MESKSEDRKDEKMGSEVKESRGEEAGVNGVRPEVGVGVTVAVGVGLMDLSLKVERR